MDQNSIIISFFTGRAKQVLSEGQSPPQELELGLNSGPYLLVVFKGEIGRGERGERGGGNRRRNKTGRKRSRMSVMTPSNNFWLVHEIDLDSQLHCSSLHCTALHCTALHLLHFNILHCITVHYTTLYDTELYWRSLNHLFSMYMYTWLWTLIRLQCMMFILIRGHLN